MKITRGLLALLFMASNAGAASFSQNIGTHYNSSWTKLVRTPVDVQAAINPAINYKSNLVNFAASVAAIEKYDAVVLVGFGGRAFENVGPFMDAVAVDKGRGLRVHMKAKARLTAGNPKVFWQIGNEINNEKLAASFHQWLGDGMEGVTNDLTIIGPYVEYWFAPMAKGLLLGDPGAKILVGSVANAASAKALSFIDTLLDYQIVGTNAPALAGMRVRDVVRMGSIHYSMGSENWLGPVDALRSRGLEVWSTEEGGRRAADSGLCMVRLITGAGRLFSLPNPGKLFIWGASTGLHTCDLHAPILVDAMGNSELVPSTSVVEGSGLETHSFRAGVKTVEFVTAAEGELGSLRGVDGEGSVYVFTASGLMAYKASPSMRITLDERTAAFVVVE